MRERFFRILMAKADDKSAGSGKTPPKGGDDDDDGDAEAAEIAKINKVVHAAVAAKMKKIEAQLAGLTGIDEKLAALTAALEAKKDEPKDDLPKDDKAGKGKPDDAAARAAEARIRAAEKKAEETEKKLLEWQAKTDRLEQGTRDDATRAALLEHFTKGGVPPAFARLAVKDVFDRVGYGDDAEGGKGKGKAYWRGEDDEQLDLAAGVASYLKTDDGKVLIPARGTGGSGKGQPNGAQTVGARDKDGAAVPMSDADLLHLVLAPPAAG